MLDAYPEDGVIGAVEIKYPVAADGDWVFYEPRTAVCSRADGGRTADEKRDFTRRTRPTTAPQLGAKAAGTRERCSKLLRS